MMKKRIFALLLSITLLLSTVVTPVSAERVNDFTVRVSDATATAGDSQVAVNILLENNPGIAGFSFCVNYDTEKLVLVESEINIEDGYKVVAQPTGYGVNLAWTGPSGYTGDGKIATLYFNIPKDLTTSEANVDIVYRAGYDSFYDSHEHDIAVQIVNGKIAISTLQETDTPSVNIGGLSVNFDATDIVVPITVKNNPGFSGFSFCVNYDTSRLVLEDTDILLDGGYKVIGHPEGYGVNIAWTSTEAYTQDGTIAELHFSLKDNANSGKAYINTAFRDGYDSFYRFENGTEQDIAFDTFGGYVDVTSHFYDNACDVDCNVCGKVREVPDHVYDNACDTACNECGFTRTVPDHVYDNACDTSCNVCDDIRTITHDYSVQDKNATNHWMKCSVCGNIDETSREAHIHDNACDTTCNECGLVRSITHDYSVQDKSAAEHWMKCSVCGVIDETTRESHIHDNACDTDCNVCGEIRSITHTYSTQDNDENEHWMKCSVCGEIDGTTREAHIHDNACDTTCNKCGEIREVPDHIYDNDCDTDCNVCGLVRAITHDYSEQDKNAETHWMKCSVCGVIDETTREAHIHDNACDTDCNVCGFTRVITHDYGVQDKNAETHWMKCSVCGVVDESTRESHGYDNTCDTTCDACGYVRTITHTYDNACDTDCNVCGEVRTITHTYDNACDTDCNVCGEIRTITHNFSVWGMDETEHWAQCSVCGVVGDESTRESHNYENENDIDCNVCGYKRYEASGITGDCTWILKNGALTISGSGAMGTYTASSSAPWGTDITSVTIEEGVTNIGDYAFYGCAALTEITIPSSVKKLGLYAFKGTENIEKVHVPSIASYLGLACSGNNDTSWFPLRAGANATLYVDGEAVVDLVIPEGITSIPNYSFHSCQTIKSLTLPSTLTSIGGGSFRASGISGTLYIPENFEKFSSTYAFAQTNLEKVVFLGSKLTATNNNTFNNCKFLVSVEFHDGIKTLGEGLFYDCSALQSVAIPNTVTTISKNAFRNCNLLADVYYNGTQTERAKISVNSTGNSVFTGATWHYESCLQGADYSHEYDNACDTTCNACGKVRQAPNHVYDNDCDTDCNVCGKTRTITHDYTVQDKDTSNHWMKCSVCGVIDETTREAHIHDNACDTTCNVCGEEREVPDHVYDNDKDLICNECGFEREPLYTPGDFDGNEGVSSSDVVYLLYHTLFGEERYPINQPCDFDKDGTVSSSDAIYLLYHTLFGKERYPL